MKHGDTGMMKCPRCDLKVQYVLDSKLCRLVCDHGPDGSCEAQWYPPIAKESGAPNNSKVTSIVEIHFDCPNCGIRIHGPAEGTGLRECLRCEGRFRLIAKIDILPIPK